MVWTGSDGFPYNEDDVFWKATTKAGVYGLFKGQTWVYFGESENIQHRLTQHLSRDQQEHPCIPKNAPTHFAFENIASGREARVARRNELIADLGSVCNQKSG